MLHFCKRSATLVYAICLHSSRSYPRLNLGTMSRRLRVYVRKDRLQIEMARRNISQNGLARAMHVSSGYMSQVFRCQRCPSPGLRTRMQDFLNIPDFDAIFQLDP